MVGRHGRRGGVWALLGAGLLLLVACEGPTQAISSLQGAHEVPPLNTPAFGAAVAILEDDELSVTGEFSGLQSDLLDVAGSPAHVHRGEKGTNGDVLFSLVVEPGENLRSGTFSGTRTLSAEERRAFVDGQLYVNVHTANNPGGEIRGQLVPE